MADVDAAVWVGLACTVFCSLVAGYARGIDRRLGTQEAFSQRNRDMIATLRADMLRDHTSKAETREHRDDVKANFERVHERLDQLLNIVGSRRGDHHQ